MYHRFLERRPRAFTLIELLVVIAIIAILAAILFPVFAQARAMARKTNGLSMCKQVALGILMYNQDYDEMFPLAGWTCGTAKGVPNVCGPTQWPNVVAPYHKSQQIVQDPADNAGWSSGGGSWSYSNGNHTLLYNDLLAHNPVTGNFPLGQVDWCGGGEGGVSGSNGCDGEAQEVGRGMAAVVAPTDCVMITEGYCPWGAANNWNLSSANDGNPIDNLPDWTGNTNAFSKWKHEQDMSQYQAELITGQNYSGSCGATFQGLPTHMSHTQTIYAYVDGHAKAVRAYDPGQANTAPYCGNLLHSTLPFRKSYDPGQNGYPQAPDTLGLGSGPPYDNWQ